MGNTVIALGNAGCVWWFQFKRHHRQFFQFQQFIIEFEQLVEFEQLIKFEQFVEFEQQLRRLLRQCGQRCDVDARQPVFELSYRQRRRLLWWYETV